VDEISSVPAPTAAAVASFSLFASPTEAAAGAEAAAARGSSELAASVAAGTLAGADAGSEGLAGVSSADAADWPLSSVPALSARLSRFFCGF